MEQAAPQLVLFHGKKLENQVSIDVSGRNTVRKVGELANRRMFKPTNLADWLILQVTDNLFFRTMKWIVFFGELMTVISEIFSPPDKEVKRTKISPTRIRLCLWNPVTLQSIDLPDIEYEYSLKECIRHVLITSNPSHQDCLVLVFLNKSILFWDVNGADKCWTSVGFPDGFFEPDGGFQGSGFVLLKGSNSILVRTGLRSRYPIAIIKIQLNPKRLVIRPLKGWVTPHSRTMVAPNPCTNNAHWVACDRDIFIVNVYRGGLVNKENLAREVVGIIVFKLEYSSSRMQYSWNILVTCPNKSFFISANQVLCFPTSKADEGNRVYMVLENERVLYTYHIENKTMSRSLLPNLPDCATPPYWISGFPSAPPLEKPNQGKYSSCGNGEKKNVLGIKLINDLPLDILKDISSRFIKNPVDYLNFRATNKLCRSVGLAKEWRNISMSPMLMIPLDNSVSFMVDPISGSKYNLSTCWGHDFSAICSSSDGWLLMYDDFIPRDGLVKLWLYNPMTKSIVCLPELIRSLSVCIITCSTDTPRCRVVRIPAKGAMQPRFLFIDLDRKDPNTEYRWNSGEINNEAGVQAINVNQSNINPACIQGKDYYYLVENGDLASYVYNRDQNRFYLRVLHLELPCSDFFEQRFIVAGYGADIILSIYIGKEWQWLRVFEFNRSKMVMEWVEVEDLRDHNIYLSTMSCICKKVAFPAKGNRIYLTRFHGDRVVYYSLDTRKFHAGEGDSSVVVSYYESEEQLHSCWFEPSLALKF